MVNKISSISMKQKEQLKKKINKLHYNEQCEIFNIIRKDTDKISENNNGIFINLKYLRDETITKLSEFVEYCDNNKLVMKVDEEKYRSEILNNVNTKNTYNLEKNISSDISSNKSNDSDIEEDLYEGYQSYIIENEQYFKNIKNKDSKITDKFSFRTYIDKLSVSSQKAFNENTEKKNPIPILKTKKIKFTGVKGRIMNRCRNINRNTTGNWKNKLNNKSKKIENIIDDNISELDKASYNSDIDYENDNDNDNDSYFMYDKESDLSNELQEELI